MNAPANSATKSDELKKEKKRKAKSGARKAKKLKRPFLTSDL
jgi:hypothetical protein